MSDAQAMPGIELQLGDPELTQRHQQLQIEHENSGDNVTRCSFSDGRRAIHTLRVEGQGILVVCTPCHKALQNQDKKKRCQYCGVPIKANWKRSALDGFHHQDPCPRNV